MTIPLGRRLAAASPVLLALAVQACAGGPPPEPVRPPAAVPPEWRVDVREHVALWYHGMAMLDAARPDTQRVLPYYDQGYLQRVAEAKAERSSGLTTLERRRDEFAQEFLGSGRYDFLHFLPLYFEDMGALFSSIQLWVGATGEGRRPDDPGARRVIDFLSANFPDPQQRRWIGEWADALLQESQSFHRAYWQRNTSALRETGAVAEREWRQLSRSLSGFLEEIGRARGEILLVPALGPEGRTVGEPIHRTAVLAPPPARPADALWAFLHEVMYDLVGEVLTPAAAQADTAAAPHADGAAGDTAAAADSATALPPAAAALPPDPPDQALLTRAAVRAGAMLLERQAPDRLPSYNRFYLEHVGRSVPAEPAAQGIAMSQAFPLPADVETGLRTRIDRALAGE